MRHKVNNAYGHHYCQSRHVDVASLTLLSVSQYFFECSVILVEEPGQVLADSWVGLDVHVPFYPAHPTYACWFISGETAGQSMTLTQCCLKKSWVTLAGWGRALSC